MAGVLSNVGAFGVGATAGWANGDGCGTPNTTLATACSFGPVKPSAELLAGGFSEADAPMAGASAAFKAAGLAALASGVGSRKAVKPANEAPWGSTDGLGTLLRQKSHDLAFAGCAAWGAWAVLNPSPCPVLPGCAGAGAGVLAVGDTNGCLLTCLWSFGWAVVLVAGL